MNEIAEEIREARKLRGWSQAELGKRIERDSQTISRYERGIETPGPSTLVRLRRVLGIGEPLALDGANGEAVDGNLVTISREELETLRALVDKLLAR